MDRRHRVCVLHDLQNGVSWGLRRFLPECEETLKSVYVDMEGLGQGFSDLLSVLPRFMESYVRFVDSDLDSSCLLEFWQALDVLPEVDRCDGLRPHMAVLYRSRWEAETGFNLVTAPLPGGCVSMLPMCSRTPAR